MKAIELTKNEREILEAIVANAKKVGDSGVEFILQDVARETGESIRSLSATTGSLAKKGMLLTANGDSYFDGELTEAGLHEVESSKVNNEQEVKQSNNSKNMTTKKAKTVKDIIDDKNLKLTEKELALVVYLNDALRSYFGEDHSDVDCNDIAKDLKWDVKTVKGVVGSLVKKNICGTYDIAGYDVVNFVGQPDMSFYHFKADDIPVPTKAEKKPKAEADKKSNAVNKPAKTARKVGEVHPKHPTWIWTEYAEGKFDWRTNPVDKKQGQRNDKKDTLKQGTHKAAKKETKPVKEEKKELTIDEFVALPKSNKSNKKPSEAQAKALKLINKGYRITADKTFFEKDDSREACNWDSVVALFRRYGIEYIPEGLVKSL